MIDITSRIDSLRTATASGYVYCTTDTLASIREGALPTGNLWDEARAAAVLGAKQTPHLIPRCHPAPIDAMEISFELRETSDPGRGEILIRASARSIGRTTIEMEALTAVSVAALVICDLIRPLDSHLEISGIRLEETHGGKSDRKYFNLPPRCAVLVCSDATARGAREDRCGKIISQMLEAAGAMVEAYEVVGDEKRVIQEMITGWVDRDVAFIFTTGGTGLGPRDHAVEAVREILERDADGIVEAMRRHGGQRTPLAMMSRAVAGTIGRTTVVTLPGSSDGARESLEALIPWVFHARKTLKGGVH